MYSGNGNCEARGSCGYGSVVEGGGRGAVSGLWLEGEVRSMLTGMPYGDLDVVRVRVRREL